jgi:hypothetical protein
MQAACRDCRAVCVPHVRRGAGIALCKTVEESDGRCGNLRCLRFECEMSGIEDMRFGVQQIALAGMGSGHRKDEVAFASHSTGGWTVLAEACVPFRTALDRAAAVRLSRILHVLIARPILDPLRMRLQASGPTRPGSFASFGYRFEVIGGSISLRTVASVSGVRSVHSGNTTSGRWSVRLPHVRCHSG